MPHKSTLKASLNNQKPYVGPSMHHYMRRQISRKRRTLALAGGKYTVGWIRDVGRKA